MNRRKAGKTAEKITDQAVEDGYTRAKQMKKKKSFFSKRRKY